MFGIFGFLGFILILVLLFVFFILAFLGNILRSIFKLGRRTPKQYHNRKATSSTDTDNSHSSAQGAPPSSANGKKKIFADDEGEYVEFEEVK